MATLKSIELSGWKSIRHARVELGRVNVLIGANGSGKSNFISFFKLLNEMIAGRLQEYVAIAGGANSLLYYGVKTTPGLQLTLNTTTPSSTLSYIVRMVSASSDHILLIDEQIKDNEVANSDWLIDTSGIFPGHAWPQPESLLRGWARNPVVETVAWPSNSSVVAMADLLRSCQPYHVNDTSSSALIRRSIYLQDNRALRPDAANLATVLHRLRIQFPDAYTRIVRTVRLINPRFGDFVLEPQALNPNQILLNWREKGQDILFGPHQLSDGTLRAMALVTLLLQPQAELPALLVIDEPELGLHPYAIGVLAALLRKASYHCQVIVSTQSVQFLNYFDPGEVIVVDRPGNETTFSRLDEAGLAGWLEDYQLGELWEKNVLGGGPH